MKIDRKFGKGLGATSKLKLPRKTSVVRFVSNPPTQTSKRQLWQGNFCSQKFGKPRPKMVEMHPYPNMTPSLVAAVRIWRVFDQINKQTSWKHTSNRILLNVIVSEVH